MLMLDWAAQVPNTEHSVPFLQGMLNRMQMSWFKYGNVVDAYPVKVDAIASLKLRLQKYDETGNTEYLMDAANFAMIEFMHPKHPEAFFQATDSDGSPGRVFAYGATQASNDGRENQYRYTREGD